MTKNFEIKEDIDPKRESLVLPSDPKISSIPISECGEHLVRLEPSSKLTIDPKFGEVDTRYSFVRISVAKGLYRASEALPSELELRIYEGWRPRSIQERYFYDFVDELRGMYKDAQEDELNRLASRYVAPPWIAPPHVTGAAVDLTLAYVDGPELDMGTKVNESPEESGMRCYMDSNEISDGARRNRKVLSRVLKAQGFANYPTEWWHWSMGDQYWCFIYGHSSARYGETKPQQPSVA